MYRQIRSEYSGRLATVTLDRPERRNAFSADLMREMIACARELEARQDVDAVIVTGAAGCFSAGADLKDDSRWAGGAPLLQQRETASLGQRMARAWEELPQVTIAAIEGYAVGGGLALAAALDWRVMARDAFVSLPEISLGIPLTWGTLPRLVNLVGPARAKRLSILCERIGAEAALAMGLVDEVCDPLKAMETAQRLAASVLDKPRHSVRMTKEAVNAYAGIGAHAVSFMAHDQLELAAASPESRAAREAALKRRRS
jgi:enoyl-CoA hydratase/carnithine racemase